MPWSVKQENGKYCVYKDSTEEKVACHSTKQDADAQVKALYASEEKQLEQLSSIMLEDGGPVVLGVAVTNNPALPLPPIELIERDNEKVFRVPFLRRGIFTDPRYGKMVFDKDVFAKILENHEKGVSHFGVSLNLRHKPELGALSWFTKDRGGLLQEEYDPNYGHILVAYGKPTTEEAEQLVASGAYRYASVEYMPKYKSSLVKQLSTDDLIELQSEDLVDLEEIMEEVTISREEYEQLKAKAESADKVEQLTEERDEAKETLANVTQEKEDAVAKVAELEAKITTLEADNDDDDDLPEAAKIKLEEQDREIRRLKEGSLAMYVENVITKAKAYRDEQGRGHSPVLLELAEKAMLGKPIEEEGVVIKLEGNTVTDVAEYTRKAWIHLLNKIPGQVLLESQSNHSGEVDNPFSNVGEFSKEDFASLWTV